MNRENTIWLVVFLIGLAVLAGRAMFSTHGMAKVYVESNPRTFVPVGEGEDRHWVDAKDAPEDVDVQAVPEEDRISWTETRFSDYKTFLDQAEGGPVHLSLPRTIGIWIAALFTLFVLSFLIKDNPFYKVAESVFVGISAAYWMVVGFWGTIVPNLLAKVSPDMIRGWSTPGLGVDERAELIYIVPLILGVMLLWRLSPKGGWISRWPMAFFIGVFCGFRLISYLHANFLQQIRNSIETVYVAEASGVDVLWESLRNFIMIVGVLSGIVYFFFSFEHKGIVGKTAKLGIWFLMITFGAAFGYTVMGRIALLAIRIEFLFDDWLWLIDPTDKRAVLETVGLLWPGMPLLL